MVIFFIKSERNSKVNLPGKDGTMISIYINLCYDETDILNSNTGFNEDTFSKPEEGPK